MPDPNPRTPPRHEPERVYERAADPAEAVDRPLEPKAGDGELVENDEPGAVKPGHLPTQDPCTCDGSIHTHGNRRQPSQNFAGPVANDRATLVFPLPRRSDSEVGEVASRAGAR